MKKEEKSCEENRMVVALLSTFSTCCLLSLSPLHASTLSSAQIGEFFTLPTWMRQATTEGISSHDTPGSDPADGTGWYIDEYTNIVEYGAWTVTCNGAQSVATVIASGEQQEEWTQEWTLSNYWNDGFYAQFFNDEVYWLVEEPTGDVVVGRKDDEAIAFDLTIEYYASSEDLDAGRTSTNVFPYRATRERTFTPVPTGRKVPRATRLTPEIQAAVNSTFEGYCERSYYALQGQSNVWDTATYGPTTRGGFVFQTTGGHRLSFDAGSNRVISTRRLVGHDDRCELADIMTGGWYSSDSVLPGWMYLLPHGSGWYDYDLVVWSTTGEGVPGAFLPEIGWQDPSYVRNAVKGTCAGFDSLASDAVWSGNDGSYAYQYRTMGHLLYKVDLGYPYWNYTDAGWTNATRLTMRDLIETNYPHADGWAISNGTRRLVSDRLCCINQTLGLMDRTYHTPSVGYPTVGKLREYEHEIRYKGSAGVTATWTWNGGGSYKLTVDPIVWQGSTETNRMSETDAALGFGYDRVRHCISRTATSTGVSARCVGLPTFMIGDADIIRALDQFIEDGNELTDGDDFHSVVDLDDITEYSVSYSVDIYGAGGYGRYYFSIPYELTNATVEAYHLYHRAYDHDFADSISLDGPTQPGWQAGDRVVARKVGSVVGMHTRDDTFYSIAEADGLPYSTDHSIFRYKTSVGDYSSRSGIASHLDGRKGDILNQVAFTYGFAPNDWQNIIPIDATDAERSRDSTVLTNCTLNLVRPFTLYYVDGRYGVSEIRGRKIEVEYVDGSVGTNYTPIAVWDFSYGETHEPKRQVEREPLTADAKVGLVTRVDWEWKTLRRIDE